MSISGKIKEYAKTDRGAPLSEKILKLCLSHPEGIKLGTLFNRFRSEARDDVAVAVVKLVDDGMISAHEKRHKRTGAEFIVLLSV